VLTDDGPGVGEAQRQNLSDALRDQNYQGRMGMGLMLADLVARAHGGHVHLPPCAQGFSVQLWIGPPVPASGSDHAAMPSAPMPL
jgi:signal transduction histidine kinase